MSRLTKELNVPTLANTVSDPAATQSLPDGVVQRIWIGITGTTLPRGAQLWVNVLIDQALVWSGYVRAASHPASFPNLRVFRGQTVIVSYWSGSEMGGNSFRVNVEVETDLAAAKEGGGSFFSSTPGTGPGTMRSVALANPAAGADFASVTVPDMVVWQLRGFAATLVAGVAVASRRLRLEFLRGGTVFAGWVANSVQMASQTTQWRLTQNARTAGDQGIRVQDILPDDLQLYPGDVIDFDTDALQAADDWGAGRLLVEEWVVPGP